MTEKSISLNRELFDTIVKLRFHISPEEIRAEIEQVRTDYSEYADVMEYMMANDGEQPSGDYFYHGGSVGSYWRYKLNDGTAELLSSVAPISDTYEEFVLNLHNRSNLTYHFDNCKKIFTREISKKEFEISTGKSFKRRKNTSNYDWLDDLDNCRNYGRLNRPRYFKGVYRHNNKNKVVYFLQPNRKKNVYFVADRRSYTIVGKIHSYDSYMILDIHTVVCPEP